MISDNPYLYWDIERTKRISLAEIIELFLKGFCISDYNNGSMYRPIAFGRSYDKTNDVYYGEITTYHGIYVTSEYVPEDSET